MTPTDKDAIAALASKNRKLAMAREMRSLKANGIAAISCLPGVAANTDAGCSAPVPPTDRPSKRRYNDQLQIAAMLRHGRSILVGTSPDLPAFSSITDPLVDETTPIHSDGEHSDEDVCCSLQVESDQPSTPTSGGSVEIPALASCAIPSLLRQCILQHAAGCSDPKQQLVLCNQADVAQVLAHAKQRIDKAETQLQQAVGRGMLLSHCISI